MKILIGVGIGIVTVVVAVILFARYELGRFGRAVGRRTNNMRFK